MKKHKQKCLYNKTVALKSWQMACELIIDQYKLNIFYKTYNGYKPNL